MKATASFIAGRRTTAALRSKTQPSLGGLGSRYKPQHVRHFQRSGFLADSSVEVLNGKSATRDPAMNKSNMADSKRRVDESGAPNGNLSIVFTDIVNSTVLWEKDAEAMTICMQLHDDIIRELTEIHHGYEVKQNGDGFMIAFPTAVSALQFCLDIQQQLLDQEWPDEITQLQPGKEEKDNDGTVLFRGLRLRMSAHWGTPVTIWNKITNRADYLGPMVNRAARFVEMTEGGQIVVSDDFLAEVQKTTNDSSEVTSKNGHQLEPLEYVGDGNVVTNENFEVRYLGEHHFKGIKNPMKLHFIIPEALHGRLNKWPQHKHVPGSKGNVVPGPS